MSDSASVDQPDDPRRHAPATLRNREALLTVLPRHLPSDGRLLEIASGSGEHAAYLAPRLPGGLIWCPSDVDPSALGGIDAHAGGNARIEVARRIDTTDADWRVGGAIAAIFCANMIHIAPWAAGRGLLTGAGRLLPPGAPLVLYGPFRRDGEHTAPSNAAFDQSLRARDANWGVRDLEREVVPAAVAAGLTLAAIESMPANNLAVVFRCGGAV